MTAPRPQHAATQSVAAAEIASADSAGRANRMRIGEREQTRRLASIALAARHACGMTQEQLGAFMGVRHQLVCDWENGEHAAAPRTDHLLRAPVAYRRHWTRELAALDGDDVSRRLQVVHESHAVRASVLNRELTDVIRTLLDDLSDGGIDRAAELLREAFEAEAALGELIAMARGLIEQKRTG